MARDRKVPGFFSGRRRPGPAPR